MSYKINISELQKLQADLTAKVAESVIAAKQKLVLENELGLDVSTVKTNDEDLTKLQIDLDRTLVDELKTGTGRRFVDLAQKQIKKDFDI